MKKLNKTAEKNICFNRINNWNSLFNAVQERERHGGLHFCCITNFYIIWEETNKKRGKDLIDLFFWQVSGSFVNGKCVKNIFKNLIKSRETPKIWRLLKITKKWQQNDSNKNNITIKKCDSNFKVLLTKKFIKSNMKSIQKRNQ